MKQDAVVKGHAAAELLPMVMRPAAATYPPTITVTDPLPAACPLVAMDLVRAGHRPQALDWLRQPHRLHRLCQLHQLGQMRPLRTRPRRRRPPAPPGRRPLKSGAMGPK
ncbi:MULTISPECIES: hypothetical protein [Streptomyces]|uniref:hypothetical protein n=1 Tax=Streptomyces TaxID=1883 RepID=UPI001E637D2F|nr:MULTISPECIES: hypothetical protein [Streptomyces]UFQ18479.1 hypothetical protein J2N69_27755 [Streptomyces huasconensis]WCL88091.1 hypothetical protein PPN52_27745 [Streptomyces sp. JCM 35825]